MASPSAGSSLGKYRVTSKLGEGGMATVYLASDSRDARAVAVKVLHPEFAATLGPERFHREVRLLSRFNHPNILPMLTSGQTESFLYLLNTWWIDMERIFYQLL